MNSPGEAARSERLRILEMELRTAARKLELIRRKQKELAEWNRSRRPIRIGFFIVIPIVLGIEAVHLYRTLATTQGGRRAPWLMLGATLVLFALSWWYYRQARAQRDRVFRGFGRAARYADDLEGRISEIRSELESLLSDTGGEGNPEAGSKGGDV